MILFLIGLILGYAIGYRAKSYYCKKRKFQKPENLEYGQSK